jgi:hypothetical protein
VAGTEPNPAAYGHMPAPPPGGRMPSAHPPVTRPRSMDLAVRFIQAGGVLSLVSIVLTVLTRDEIRAAAEKRMRDADPKVTQAQIDSAMSLGLAVGVVWGLVVAALWFTMAALNGRGQSWARILSAVFFMIATLLTILSLTQSTSGLARALTLLSSAVGCGAMYFLFRPESTAYYQARSGKA